MAEEKSAPKKEKAPKAAPAPGAETAAPAAEKKPGRAPSDKAAASAEAGDKPAPAASDKPVELVGGVAKQPTAEDLLKEELGAIKVRKAKGSKNVTSGVVNVLASFNNTIVSITDGKGQVIAWSSAGKCNFRGSRKSTAYAAQVVAQDAARNAMSHGLKDIVTGKTYWSHHDRSPMWDAGAVVYWFKLVRTKDGIDWVNDSKATNPHAAAAALGSYLSCVWIAGGLAKGTNMADLIRKSASRIKAAILIGSDREIIAEKLAIYAPSAQITRLDMTGTPQQLLESVVQVAKSLATDGDTVLLSPACASMDQFKSYAERGKLFCEAVERLI